MNHSESLDKIAPALVAFQAEVEGVDASATNSEFGSRYADLASIWKAIRGPLTKHGLSIVQLPGPCQGVKMTVATMILHTSGQFIRHEGTFPIDAQNVHSAASGVSYLKRYALQAALGLPSLDDDDGNAAAGRGGIKPFSKPYPTQSAPVATVPIPKPSTWETGGMSPEPDNELTKSLEELMDERLIPSVRNEPWARFLVTKGKNAGKFLGELDDDALAGYEKVFCPPEMEEAVKAWRGWKEANLALMRERNGFPEQPEKKRTKKTPLPPADESEEASIPPKVNPDIPAPESVTETRIHFGKNRGVPLADLTPQAVHWYETDWMPKKEAIGATSIEDIALIAALKDYRDWRAGTYSPPIPGITAGVTYGGTVSERRIEGAFEEVETNIRPMPEEAPAAAAAAPAPAPKPKTVPSPEQLAAREALKAKKLVKRPERSTSPEKAPETPEAVSTPPAQETGQGGAAKGLDWRDYVLQIGKEPSEGGNKGKKLGDLTLQTLKWIKEKYLDKRQWDKPDTLKEFDLELKRMVETGIKNDGKAPEEPKPDLAPGPLKELFERLESFAIDPEGEFVPKMRAIGRLPETVLHFEHIRYSEAQAFLAGWDQTMEDFDKNFEF